MRNVVVNKRLFILGFLLFGFYLSKAQIDSEDPYASLALQKKAIIGTWMNTGANTDEIGDHRWTMKFTADGKCYDTYTYDDGRRDVETYTYTVTDYVNNNDMRSYALSITNVDGSGEHYAYEMYIGRDEDNNYDEMSLHSGIDDPFMQPGNFVFKKIKN